MSGEILRVQAQCDEKISEYETKLELAHGNRMSSMFQMKEEVESEFTGRMEQVSFLSTSLLGASRSYFSSFLFFSNPP